ncbi:TetR/AcrR family transcriptional regulator [Tsukamurella pseudospumae]|uniref:TetR family transcriptional regulator n=1 Tax=Tsukamurella pseudospumae TaxID=239498 RepID=A0A138AWR9_9ACTN|nr:TetR/AcrR family transcriptional regulator [Tsukamurella pseudospumae]KXP14860.1 TetR family transcriptional regulator [Tsukamurella pseudospumae]
MRSTETFTEQARRAQIAGCAIDTIAELGYGKASVRKIADRAGVAMSVVLYHFGDKDSLIAAVVHEFYSTLLAEMVPAVEAAPTAAAKLEAHIRTHLRYMRTHRNHQLALMEIAGGFRTKDGGRLQGVSVDASHDDARSQVELDVILAGGIESGEFRPLNVASMATAIRGAVGSAILATLTDPRFDLDAYADDLVDAFTRATRTDQEN